MVVLAEVFDQGKEPSKEKIMIYFEALRDYDISAIETAASNIIKSRVYPAFPKPAEIIREITGSDEDRAFLAWAMVCEGIKRAGNYPSVRFSDPLIHSVITFMGGWPKICQIESEKMVWVQKEFERIYQISAVHQGKPADYLPGDIEIGNGGLAKRFETIPEITYISRSKDGRISIQQLPEGICRKLYCPERKEIEHAS